MHKRITFRNMDHSDVMEEYINKQLEKVEKFLKNERDPVYIDMVLDASKTREHPHAELRIKAPDFELISSYEKNGVQMYDVIDRVIDIMYKQLRQHKQKEVEQRKIRGRHEDFKKQR